MPVARLICSAAICNETFLPGNMSAVLTFARSASGKFVIGDNATLLPAR
jgi:hypothetical protein